MQTATGFGVIVRVQLEKAPVPRGPQTIEETGLGADQLMRLFVKTLYTGEATGVTVADRLRLPYAIFEPLIEDMRAERLIEVKGTAGSGTAALPLHPDRPRPRSRAAVSGRQPVRRAGAGAARAPTSREMKADRGGARLHRSRAAAPGVLSTSSSRLKCSSSSVRP